MTAFTQDPSNDQKAEMNFPEPLKFRAEIK